MKAQNQEQIEKDSDGCPQPARNSHLAFCCSPCRPDSVLELEWPDEIWQNMQWARRQQVFKSAANIGILSDAAIMKTSEDFYLMHHLEELGHISKVQEVLCWDVLLHSTVWGGYFNQHDKKIKNLPNIIQVNRLQDNTRSLQNSHLVCMFVTL